MLGIDFAQNYLGQAMTSKSVESFAGEPKFRRIRVLMGPEGETRNSPRIVKGIVGELLLSESG